MEERNRIPEIRFKGFNDDWEQRKLGDIGYAKSGVGFPDSEQGGQKGIPFFKVSDMNTNGNENELMVANNYVTDEQIARKHWNVIYDVPAIFFAKVGAAVMLNRKRLVRFPFLLDNNTMAYVFEKKVWNCDFGKTLFETIDLTKLTQVGALPSYNSSDIESIQILIPKFEEQTKIGQYFSQLDNLITLHQRKHDNLVQLKKSMLSKMFPQGHNKIPNLRFNGFTDDWEQRKLSEVAEIVGGGTPSTNIPEYWDGDIDWYAPAEINDQIYVDGSERKITKLGLEKSSAKILPADKTVLFTSRAGIGKTAILRRSGATNQGFQSMVLNDETNPYFVFSMSKFIKEEAERVASGSTFAEVSGKMLGNLAFMFPTKKEQDKIGEYFSNLDNLITLHQRKVDKLKTVKKSMLSKMFVK